MHWPASMPWSVGDRQRDAFLRIRFQVWLEIFNSSVSHKSAAPPTTVLAIHFGRVVLLVAIKYRPGSQFLLLLNSNLSVFDVHGMEDGQIGAIFRFRFILFL